MTEKILVLDIDGTLTNSQKEISPATRAGLKNIMERGHKVILASGRPTPGMRRYEEELELEKYGGYLISFNGARIVECSTGEILYQRTLPLPLLPSLYGFAEKNGCGLVTYLGSEVISAFAPDEYIELEARINGLPIRRVERFLDFVDFDINKCLMTADPERAAVLEKELQQKYGDVASIYRSEPFFIEIMPKNVDKGAALDKMLETIGQTRENIICCGDGFNDVSMIKYAGVGVAMGNAQTVVKEAADYVTDTNDDDGLVRVIDEFILTENEKRPGRNIRIKVPEKARYIIDTLTAAGFEAYAVGGCVRDSILGREPQDWDITTSARPEQVKGLFGRTVDTGLQHGTVTVMLGREGFEVTTYRVDGKYEDGRHPSRVTFTPSLKEDLRRRDLTINAMAYNEEEGLVDLFGGLEDIREKKIRCVGNPEERFQEDALRILRAVRFSAQLGYQIEEETREALTALAPGLNRVSAERIQAELIKLVISPNPDYLRIAYETGVTKVFLPEFDVCMETPQNHPHHCCSVGEHILRSMKAVRADKVLRLTMLFHDMGKPRTVSTDEDGITHFHGHAKVGADMAKEIMRRLKFDNDTMNTVCRLVLYHDYCNGVSPDMRLVRRAANRIGEDIFPLLFEVCRADIEAQSDYFRREKLENADNWQRMYEEVQEQNQCVSLKTLAVTGSDLIAAGWKPGRELGGILRQLLELVLEKPECNEKEYLLKEAEKYH